MGQAADASQSPVDRELVLHYIDKLHASYMDTTQTFQRVVVVLVILSFLVFGLALGIVSIDRSFAFGGLTLAINSALILIGGSALIGILLLYFLSLIAIISNIEKKILELYRSLGMDEEQLLKDKDGSDRLGFAGILEISSPEVFGVSRTGKVTRRFVALVGLGVYFLFPIVAQIAAFWRMVVLFGWNWWVLASFTLLFLLTIISVSLFFKSYTYHLTYMALNTAKKVMKYVRKERTV